MRPLSVQAARLHARAGAWLVLGMLALVLASRPVGAAEPGTSCGGLPAAGPLRAAAFAAPSVPTRQGWLEVVEGKAAPGSQGATRPASGAAALLVLDGQGAAAAPDASNTKVPRLYARPVEQEARSALFTEPAPAVSMFTATWGAQRIVGWMHEHPRRGAVLLALLVPEVDPAGRTALAAYWHEQGQDGSAGSRLLDVATLEHLYAHVLRQPAGQAFALRRVQPGTQAKPAATGPFKSQKDVLAAVAALRECAVEPLLATRSEPALRRWRAVSIEASRPAGSAARDKAVAVKVTNARGPVAGATVGFARDPHWICNAKTDAAGLAQCHLWDAHGHAGHDHGEEEGTVTIATFSGVIDHGSIDLPTTLVMGNRPPAKATRTQPR